MANDLPEAGAAAAVSRTSLAAFETPVRPLLDVRDLRVRFPVCGSLLQRAVGHFDAVAGVSFTLDQGKTLSLVGESGCG